MGRTVVLLIAAALASSACVAPRRQHSIELNQKIAYRSWDAAVAQIDAAKDAQYGQRNSVLYWLDRATVLHDAGRYQESDQYLDLAERRMEELYTRSVSKAAAAFLINEGTEDYAGQVHERTLLHVLRALNFAYLRQVDEATVEARKVTAFLAELNDRLGDQRLAYRDDAFAQYLSALLFEDQGRSDDARICYEAARTAYGWYAGAFGVVPPPLPFGVRDGALAAPPPAADARTPAAVELPPAPPAGATPIDPGASAPAPPPWPAPSAAPPSAAPGLPGVVPAVLSTPGARPGPTPIPPAGDGPAAPAAPGELGELVFLHYNGPGPRKETATLQIAWGKAMVVLQASREAQENTQVKNALIAGIAGNAVTFAYPTFVQDPFSIQESEVEVGAARVRTVLVEDVTAIARSTLAAALPAIQAKAIVRAMTKFLLARLAEEQAKKRLGAGWGALAGLAGRVAAAASEVADTRGWGALPAQFRIARVPLPAGTHAVRVRYLGAGDHVVAEDVLERVEIKPGRRTYLHLRTAL